ncbi:MAG TPA: hypothetical protein VIS52_07060 [Motiliproteus sp.]
MATLLKRQLQGLTLYSDGWVVDNPWRVSLFTAAGIAPRFALNALEVILNPILIKYWHPSKIN